MLCCKATTEYSSSFCSYDLPCLAFEPIKLIHVSYTLPSNSRAFVFSYRKRLLYPLSKQLLVFNQFSFNRFTFASFLLLDEPSIISFVSFAIRLP
jgi:hypothetical protein